MNDFESYLTVALSGFVILLARPNTRCDGYVESIEDT